jgi:hypothetical protein
MHPTILFLQLHYYILSCQSYKKVLKRRPNYIKVHSPEKHTRIFSDIAGDEPAGRGGRGAYTRMEETQLVVGGDVAFPKWEVNFGKQILTPLCCLPL